MTFNKVLNYLASSKQNGNESIIVYNQFLCLNPGIQGMSREAGTNTREAGAAGMFYLQWLTRPEMTWTVPRVVSSGALYKYTEQRWHMATHIYHDASYHAKSCLQVEHGRRAV